MVVIVAVTVEDYYNWVIEGNIVENKCKRSKTVETSTDKVEVSFTVIPEVFNTQCKKKKRICNQELPWLICCRM